ncbi:MAG TPA: thioredoxin domain-containing protein [Methylomirabilota bacterium]|jgi:protein-disulfide isomerase|nr:thioredoxin domain-containing protein [Methylomirabilota bacterium]
MIKRILILILILAAVVGIGFWLKSISPNKVVSNANLTGDKVYFRPYTYMTGKTDAKVTLVEFGDYQCPFCAAAHPTVKTLVDKYKSNPDFNFIFREFPLSQHPNAQAAAEAAESAGVQGKYWEMHDLLYDHQNDWSGTFNPNSTFESYAQQLGLDGSKFKTDLETGAYIDNITQDELDGEALGVNATPTFYLNGQQISDYKTLDASVSAALGAK